MLYARWVQSLPAISIFVLTVPGSRQLTVGGFPDSRSACSTVNIIIASLLSEYALCWLKPFSCGPLKVLLSTELHQASAGCDIKFTASAGDPSFPMLLRALLAGSRKWCDAYSCTFMIPPPVLIRCMQMSQTPTHTRGCLHKRWAVYCDLTWFRLSKSMRLPAEIELTFTMRSLTECSSRLVSTYGASTLTCHVSSYPSSVVTILSASTPARR